METLLLPDLTNVPLDQFDGTRLLGLSASPIEAVRAGLSYNAFGVVAAALGLGTTELAGVLAIAPRTLARRRACGRLEAEESDRLLSIARLVELAVVVFEDVDAAAAWLQTPARMLGGESPLAHADTAHGVREVEDILFAIEFTAAA